MKETRGKMVSHEGRKKLSHYWQRAIAGRGPMFPLLAVNWSRCVIIGWIFCWQRPGGSSLVNRSGHKTEAAKWLAVESSKAAHVIPLPVSLAGWRNNWPRQVDRYNAKRYAGQR